MTVIALGHRNEEHTSNALGPLLEGLKSSRVICIFAFLSSCLHLRICPPLASLLQLQLTFPKTVTADLIRKCPDGKTEVLTSLPASSCIEEPSHGNLIGRARPICCVHASVLASEITSVMK